MSHPDDKQDQDSTPGGGAADASASKDGAQLVPNEQAFQLDLEAGPILAELLASGVAPDTTGDDIHAALASLGEEAFQQLDPATQHLTETVDLFDVPVSDTGDAA